MNQIKEMYAQREKDNELRHRDEIRELKTEHGAELERVRQEDNDRLEAVQSESQAKLTAKDLQNRKEVEAIRSMYQKRLAESKTQKD